MQALPSRNNSIILMIELMLFIDCRLESPALQTGPGRPAKLSDLEALTILAYDSLVEQHQTLRGAHSYIRREYSDCFQLPTYQNSAAHCLRLTPVMGRLLRLLLASPELVFADSTPMAVCHPIPR